MKPESRYIARIHKQLPFTYKEKMHNAYRAGGADCWYSGELGDYWVEYKWLPKVPVRTNCTPDLTSLQLRWLRERRQEGRNVVVCIGSPEGGAMLWDPTEWQEGITPDEFRKRAMKVLDVADWIYQRTGRSPCLSHTLSLPSQESLAQRTVS